MASVNRHSGDVGTDAAWVSLDNHTPIEFDVFTPTLYAESQTSSTDDWREQRYRKLCRNGTPDPVTL